MLNETFSVIFKHCEEWDISDDPDSKESLKICTRKVVALVLLVDNSIRSTFLFCYYELRFIVFIVFKWASFIACVCSNKIVKQGQFENFASSSNLSFPTFSSTWNARVYILNGFLALENCSSHVLLLLHKSPKTWLILETSFFDTEKIWMTKENRFVNFKNNSKV